METLFASEWLLTFGLFMVVFVGVVSILFELLEIIFILTPTKKDDQWLAKMRTKWEKVRPYLEWFHIKTPITKILNKILLGFQLIKKVVLNMKKNRDNKDGKVKVKEN